MRWQSGGWKGSMAGGHAAGHVGGNQVVKEAELVEAVQLVPRELPEALGALVHVAGVVDKVREFLLGNGANAEVRALAVLLVLDELGADGKLVAESAGVAAALAAALAPTPSSIVGAPCIRSAFKTCPLGCAAPDFVHLSSTLCSCRR